MPSNIVKSFASTTGKTEKEVDDLWNKAKEIASDEGHAEEYDYIVGILKKMLKINESSFKEFISKSLLNEERHADYNGIYIQGSVLEVDIKRAEHNNLMRLEFSGDKTLVKLPSAEKLKSEYSEDNWVAIEKLWANLAKKKSADIEKIVNRFEKDISKVISEMEKELSKL